MGQGRDFLSLCADWHGGQTSPMYAFLSSGTVISGLAGEIRSAIRYARKHRVKGCIRRLQAFLRWAEEYETEGEDFGHGDY